MSNEKPGAPPARPPLILIIQLFDFSSFYDFNDFNDLNDLDGSDSPTVFCFTILKLHFSIIPFSNSVSLGPPSCPA